MAIVVGHGGLLEELRTYIAVEEKDEECNLLIYVQKQKCITPSTLKMQFFLQEAINPTTW